MNMCKSVSVTGYFKLKTIVLPWLHSFPFYAPVQAERDRKTFGQSYLIWKAAVKIANKRLFVSS